MAKINIKPVTKSRLAKIAAEKEAELNALPEGVGDAIRCHEEWVNSQGEDGFKMDLRGENLANIKLTVFYKLDEAELRNTDLSNAQIYASLNKACLAKCRLVNSCFGGTLKKANFDGAEGENVSFNACDCSGAGFNNAILIKSNFSYANFEEASFENADLSEANFKGARLESADFCYANLKGANLMGTHGLATADFYGADISGAKLPLCDITMAQLSSCRYTPELAQMIQTKYYLLKGMETENI